jgi:hypothetical protein
MYVIKTPVYDMPPGLAKGRLSSVEFYSLIELASEYILRKERVLSNKQIRELDTSFSYKFFSASDIQSLRFS